MASPLHYVIEIGCFKIKLHEQNIIALGMLYQMYFYMLAKWLHNNKTTYTFNIYYREKNLRAIIGQLPKKCPSWSNKKLYEVEIQFERSNVQP